MSYYNMAFDHCNYHLNFYFVVRRARLELAKAWLLRPLGVPISTSHRRIYIWQRARYSKPIRIFQQTIRLAGGPGALSSLLSIFGGSERS